MIKNEQEAIQVGIQHLLDLGIEILRVNRIKKIDGAVRGILLPKLNQDFWMITFDRTNPLILATDDADEIECEILSIVAKENVEITVTVEQDGSVQVI